MHRRDVLKAAVAAVPLGAAGPLSAVPPVVLELFTSQGCSSCPPADALLGELVRRPRVIGLAWHVDYWNRLGWRDPFARPEWTDRQRAYAAKLEAEVYTPAMVINGGSMVVGSDRTAVGRAMERSAQTFVNASLRRTNAGSVAEIGALPTAATGMIAIYDPRQSTTIGAGENGGRQLVEFRVVRDVVRLQPLAAQMTLPEVSATQGAVLLIQDAAWHVIGAADLPPVQGA